MNRILQMVFDKRKYEDDFLDKINDSSREELGYVDDLTLALYHIREKGEKLVVLPDFDMDGIMSGVIGFAGFAELGFNVELFMPKPELGYGFNKNTIDRLIAEHPGVCAIISCDNGITAFEGVEYAKSKGLDVFITDHHKTLSKASNVSNMNNTFVEDIFSSDGEGIVYLNESVVGEQVEILPEADVIVNPMRLDDNYEHKGICGAHVIWQCLYYFAKTYGTKEQIIQLERLQVFAGIGTVSDMMPMLYENRLLVKNAIAICKIVMGSDANDKTFIDMLPGTEPYRLAFQGLYNVLNLYREEGKITKPEDIDEDFFGFYMAPMFNALKRLEGDMNLAFRVFFDYDSTEYLKQLYILNEQRKLLVEEYMFKLRNQDNPYAPYIYISDASAGILGLLASKLMHESHLPTFVVSKNDDGYGYKGSGRSPEWFLANTILSAEGFWIAGHEGAFGCGFTDTRNMKSLYAFLNKEIPEILSDVEKVSFEDSFDYILDTSGEKGIEIDIPEYVDFYYDCKRLQPFGQSFAKPEGLLRIVKNDRTSVEFMVMGTQKQHLKISLPRGFEVLAWNQAHLLDDLMNRDEILVSGVISQSEFRGATTINFMGNIVEGSLD